MDFIVAHMPPDYRAIPSNDWASSVTVEHTLGVLGDGDDE